MYVYVVIFSVFTLSTFNIEVIIGGNIIVNNAITIPPLNFGMVLDSTTFVLDNNSDNLFSQSFGWSTFLFVLSLTRNSVRFSKIARL